MRAIFRTIGLCGLLLLSSLSQAAGQDEFEKEPIEYSKATPQNAVTRLQQQIDAGQIRLQFDDRTGYLRALLQALAVPESSQMLVFSKTSFQRQRISPKMPRAIYFNDNVYVGYCRDGDLMEVTAVDPQLGAVFYSLDQEPASRPRLQRQTDTCLICHASSQTNGVPGHLARSVYVDPNGFPLLGSGTFRTDQTLPLKHRWGGWYVTGTHGDQTHLGNLVVVDKRPPEEMDNKAGMNLINLGDRFDATSYLKTTSDIVALLVMEHQTTAQNLITAANFQTRLALHQEKMLNRELKQPSNHRWESTTSRIKAAGEPLLKYLLFCDEAALTSRVKGTTNFAAEFSHQGPRDPMERSLRDFDLTRRLFRYPCSYLIYSAEFDALPAEMQTYVYRRMYEVLTGRDTSGEFAHLSAADRQAILEILRTTKRGLPPSWNSTTARVAR